MNEEILEIQSLLENRVQPNWNGIETLDLQSLEYAMTNNQNYNFYPSSFTALRNYADGVNFLTDSESAILKDPIFWSLNNDLLSVALLRKYIKPDRKKNFRNTGNYSLAENYLGFCPRGEISSTVINEIIFSFSFASVSNPNLFFKFLNNDRFPLSEIFGIYIILCYNEFAGNISPRIVKETARYLLKIKSLAYWSQKFQISPTLFNRMIDLNMSDDLADLNEPVPKKLKLAITSD